MDKPLFVFSIGGLKQIVKSLLTPVSETVFLLISHMEACILFSMVALLTAYVFQRILLAFEENQPIRKWSKKLPWKAKSRLPREIEKKNLFRNRCQK